MPWPARTRLRIDRVPDGGIEIVPTEAGPHSSIGTATVQAVGGELEIAAISSQRLAPRATLHDPYWSEAWLAGVYGEDVATAVREVAADDTAGPREVSAEPGFLAGPLDRFAVGIWLHRWWPSGSADVPEIDAWLLELEIGAAARECEALLVDHDRIAAWLEPHADLVRLHLTTALRFGTGTTVAEDLRSLLTRSLRALIETGDPDREGADDDAALLDRLGHGVGAARDAWTPDLAGPALRKVAGGTRGGHQPRSGVRRGTLTVDQLHLDPRLVRSAEQNLQWEVRPGTETDRLTVEVLVAPARTSLSSPYVYLRARTGDRPLQVGALRYDESRHVLRGELDLPSSETEPTLDVCTSGFASVPRWHPEGRSQARAERTEVHEHLRLRAAAPDPFLAERIAWSREAR